MTDSDSSDSTYEFSIDNIPKTVLNLNYYYCTCIYTFSAWLSKNDNDLFKGIQNWIPQLEIQYIFKKFFKLPKKTLKKLNIDCVEYMRIQILDCYRPVYGMNARFIWETLINSHKLFIAKD